MTMGTAIHPRARAFLAAFASSQFSNSFGAADRICYSPDGKPGPCGPGVEWCQPSGWQQNTAQYHVRDFSCQLNDPNGPVFDPVHGVYHIFYQDHIAMGTGQITYGHAVSRDFTHWAHMPIAIWNDQPYDATAVYTGSATVVDGKVVQVYPGLCSARHSEACPGGPANLAIAVPADPQDPLQAKWDKQSFAVNPIQNMTDRDPSTAWQTSAGEWRLVTYNQWIYGSEDFKEWYRVGQLQAFPNGECPSFFPLPRTTPGAGPAPPGAATPTHVYKVSKPNCTVAIQKFRPDVDRCKADWMQVGTYREGPRNSTGTWSAVGGVPFELVSIDSGVSYAAKDFYDPVKGRRINWGWASTSPATMTLPREVTWHPQLQQLIHSPVEEQESLRGKHLGKLSSQDLPVGEPVPMHLPYQIGNQSEVLISFTRPSVATRFGVRVLAADDKSLPDPYAELMPGMSMMGKDYKVMDVDNTQFATCQHQCALEDECVAW